MCPCGASVKKGAFVIGASSARASYTSQERTFGKHRRTSMLSLSRARAAVPTLRDNRAGDQRIRTPPWVAQAPARVRPR